MELFEELFGVKLPADDEPIEEPPTNGGTMITRKGTVVAKGLHVRKGPGTEYDDALPGLVEKDQVEADRIENGYWWHLTKIKGVAVTVEAWSSAGETGGYIRTDEVIEPPSGGEPVTVEMLANGAVVHSSQVQPGGKVTITVTDA